MLKLKGLYDSNIQYDVSDVVVAEDGNAYRLMLPAPSGVPPVDTRYWGRTDPILSECAQLIMSCMVVTEKPAVAEQPKKTTRKREATAK